MMRRTPMRSKPKPPPPPEIRKHWDRVRALGCVVSGNHAMVTLHHVHSGSIAEIGVGRQKWKTSDWLVIPLIIELHSIGPEAIDGSKGVRSWEAQYGRQVDHVDWVCRQLGVNVWKLAGVEREVEGL
jgi:type IV secretory pathway TrbF-like protein